VELKFEWDPRKAASNLVKHGVSFQEAATVFGDALGRIVEDPRHSSSAARGFESSVPGERLGASG
jgi:uncharacterized DUF497 family protein